MAEKLKIEHLSKNDIKERGIETWGIWEKEPSEFDWSYTSEEHCYIIEGEAKIELPEGKEVTIKEGDYVVFPLGLSCRWKVIRPLKKYYEFV